MSDNHPLLAQAQNADDLAGNIKMHSAKSRFMKLASVLAGFILPASARSTLVPKPVSETGIARYVLDYGKSSSPSAIPI